MVTLGASIERGAVRAVALSEVGGRWAERVLVRRVVRTGTDPADIAVAVEVALDAVAAELRRMDARESAAGPEAGEDGDEPIGDLDSAIAGAAVVYRETAQRRAVVTRLAEGRWHGAALVPSTSAHLSVAADLPSLTEFGDLLVCDVVPGYQACTVVDAARSRVLAATGRAGTVAALGDVVRAASDQSEAAGVRLDAVVLIGSAADSFEARAAVEGLGVPVLSCPLAPAAAAVGAARWVLDDLADGGDEVAAPARHRLAPALPTAVGALACGLLTAGLYAGGGLYNEQRDGGPLASDDARVTANTEIFGDTVSFDRADAGSRSPVRPEEADPQCVDPECLRAAEVAEVQHASYALRSPQSQTRWEAPGIPLSLEPVQTAQADVVEAPGELPGAGLPTEPTLGDPDALLLFPGEAPPPPAFTPESYRWWDNHVRLIAQWAAQRFAGA
ncbi:hypothetical protein [Nocardia shimofusensis]|uniref:hypothetical protein n=1 Tax=Nocardia shimofusensis TaxID=228596 RepID=UPI0008317D83|nr:hypothetical protein [Nocardia shimofusensis]